MNDIQAIGLLLMCILITLVGIFMLLFMQYQKNEWRYQDRKEEARDRTPK